MNQLEQTIILVANAELATVKAFVDKTEFTGPDVDDLISAHDAAYTPVQLALIKDSGMSEHACVALRQLEKELICLYIGGCYPGPGLR
jgi:hypothetical protein